MYVECEAYFDNLLQREEREVLAFEFMILGRCRGSTTKRFSISDIHTEWLDVVYILVEGLWRRKIGRAGRLHRSGELHSFSQQSSHNTPTPTPHITGSTFVSKISTTLLPTRQVFYQKIYYTHYNPNNKVLLHQSINQVGAE